MRKFGILFALVITTHLQADVTAGKLVYEANCATCHSTNMTGGLGRDFNLVSYTREKKDIEQYAKDPYSLYKKFGYSANAMPTLPLTDKEFKDVADYIDSLQPFKEWMKKKKK